MVFITAGMDGGTGNDAAPVIHTPLLVRRGSSPRASRERNRAPPRRSRYAYRDPQRPFVGDLRPEDDGR
jgi:hypothetical protein